VIFYIASIVNSELSSSLNPLPMPQNGYGDDSIDRSTIKHPEDEIVSQDDLCPICHLLLCRPVITSCNHTLCLSCMTHWAKASLESTFTFVPLDEVPQGIAADQIEVKCPMCRQMGSAIADENRERELVQMYPETYEERKEEEREDLESERSNTEVITLYIGNLHRLIDQDETEGPNQHDWMFFMRPSRSDVIREIRVELVSSRHESSQEEHPGG